MKFTIVKNTSTLTELTRQLFATKGPGAKAREKQIEASLLAANPHLTDLEHISAGTPIVLPVIDVEARPKESASVAPALVQQVRAQLGGLLKSLEKTQADEIAQLEQTEEILKSKDFKAARGETPDPQKRLSKMDSAAAARLTEIEQLQKSQQTGIDQLGKDLDDFIGRFL
jgi:hypothetical protein